MRYVLLILGVAAVAVGSGLNDLARASFNPEPGATVLAIRHATVETLGPAGTLTRATIVIRNGKIEAVGKDVPVPDDARVIDAAGGTVLPGIIDPHFEVSIAAATAESGTRTVVFGGRTITLPAGGMRTAGTFTRIADNFYPYDAGYKPLPRIGLTRINLVTSGAGQAAVVRVSPTEPEHMLDRADGVAFASVTNQTDSLDQIRTRLEAAARAKSAGGSAAGNRFQAGATTGTQLWTDVHDGKVPLIASVNNSATVLHVLKAIEPYKNVKLVIFGSGAVVAEAIDSLKGCNVRIVLRPSLEHLPNSRDRFAPARLLHEAGIEFGFTLSGRPPAPPAIGAAAAQADTQPAGPDDNPALQDFPLFPVAMLVKSGLPRKMALEALSKRPAAMLGLEATHGSLEPGKAADLLLFTGDPLDPITRLRLTLIDGRTTYANE